MIIELSKKERAAMANRVRAADDPPKKAASGDEAMMAEFKELLVIDKHALDDALEQHPDLLYRISEILTERIAERDTAKLEVAEAEAKVDADIRRDAAVAEEKVTADQVKSQVKLDRSVRAATDRHASLVYWCNRWSSLKEAFAARQGAMRELVSLYGNNYWSDASTGRATSSRQNRAGEKAREALAAERRRQTA